MTIYLATVDCAISMPIIFSSPWIRGAPQSGLARLISRIRSLISFETLGLPPRGRDFERHNARKPMRCQRTSVSDWTICIALRTSGKKRYINARISRSLRRKVSCLGARRLSVMTCWRNAVISASRTERGFVKSEISRIKSFSQSIMLRAWLQGTDYASSRPIGFSAGTDRSSHPRFGSAGEWPTCPSSAPSKK